MTREEALPIAQQVAFQIERIRREPDYQPPNPRHPNNKALEGAINRVTNWRRCPKQEVIDAVNTILPELRIA